MRLAMSDMVAFLRARLDEEEVDAKALNEWQDGEAWYSDAADMALWMDIDPAPAAVFARCSPARVLADVQAKRAILDLHAPEEFHDAPGEFFCRHDQRTAGIWPCPTVRLLALPYADHPDYDESWRP